MYFNVNFNVFFKIKMHLLVSEFYIFQNARCNYKKMRSFDPHRGLLQVSPYSNYRQEGSTVNLIL